MSHQSLVKNRKIIYNINIYNNIVKENNMEITKDMLIADALRAGNTEAIASTLQSIGMHCFGCAMARGETVEEAAMVHGVDVDDLVKQLNVAAKSE